MLIKNIATHLAKLALLLAALTLSSGAYAQVALNLTTGWNLLGNSSAAPVDVAATFGDATKITTVWTWNKTASKWAFYAPSMNSTALTTYAQGKGYDVLTSIAPKEGFWVNASTAAALTGPVANAVTLVASDLQQSWNLMGSADNKTPSQLNQALSSSLSSAGKAIVTAWAWDAPSTKWKFYAPSLEAQGGTVLADYITSKGYLAFSTALSAADGFWLNIGAASGSGQVSGELKWSYSTGRPIYYSSPAIGTDGTIYVANGAPFGGGTTSQAIYALNPAGTLKWKYDTGINMYAPSLGLDGTVYVQDALSKLYAINSDGSSKWTYSLNAQSNVGQTAPAVGSDGTVYVGADALYAINPDGTLKWKNQLGCGGNWLCQIAYIRSSPAIASDGTIYVGATGTFAYCPPGATCIAGGALFMAVNPDGTSKWNYILQGTNAIFSSPAIGSDGAIYIGAETSTSGYVYALNPDGTQKWRYATNNTVRSSPAIGADGTIYIGTKSYLGTQTATSTNAEFLALNPDGTLKWSYTVVQVHATADDTYSSPAIGADGLIYFGAETGFLYALNPDGTLAWEYNTNNGINWTSPAIAGDGTLYIGSNDGNLFAINSGSLGLANSPWPKFRHDNRNTGKF